ncbi:putative O-methyltransferase YrrM [Labrenzia sp. EL_13]|uniref:class I SAM-dependent methyltransferase n=1 Tax=Roseibium album TaxID=311410 RepID=UPI0018C9F39E|nr:class I SAM-dependent methyltransferase [Roseibium album]MBG6156185.1 putative O-methyltransferase YrrM [Labrenzia sp. EL_162]MBG6194718.1 putative O-methyltransferase YrrM [Labrenzia sp. EL_159]MBG6200351.1 putative O-methyltransferase YrrM [Labrenzia sp. EL_13]
MYEEVIEKYNNTVKGSENLHFNAKHYLTMHSHAASLSNPTILELGVQSGNSTKLFLNALGDSQKGVLVSVDIDNCSGVASSSKWTFIRSDSADVENIVTEAPILKDGIDILFIDSLHTTEHVYKELYGFFPYIKKGGVIFFDDIDSAPYCEGNELDSYYVELENRRILKFINCVFESNMQQLDLTIYRGWTGLGRLDKRSELYSELLPPQSLKRRKSKKLWKIKRSLKKRNLWRW